MKRVLVVDDSEAFCVSVEELLANADIDVRSCYTGEDALTELKIQKYDLVILDVKLPGINGYEVLKEIRMNPGIDEVKVILITGHQDPPELMELEKQSIWADDYILKNPDPYILLEKINNLI